MEDMFCFEEETESLPEKKKPTKGKKVKKVVCDEHPNALVLEDFIPNAVVCSQCGKRLDSESGQGGSSTKNSRSLQCQRRSENILSEHFKEIKAMADRINLPVDVARRAQILFKDAFDCCSLRRYSNVTKTSVCLYVACRQEYVPRTLKEICAISSVPKKDIGRCLNAVCKHLKINFENLSTSDFMSRFTSKLELPKNVEKTAMYVANRAVELELLVGRSPISIAAAAIYLTTLVSGIKKSQRLIKDVTGVADTTIRKLYKLMCPHIRRLFPEGYKQNLEIPYDSDDITYGQIWTM